MTFPVNPTSNLASSIPGIMLNGEPIFDPSVMDEGVSWYGKVADDSALYVSIYPFPLESYMAIAKSASNLLETENHF